MRFGDIDYAGIVYYPRFLHYFHVALEEFFESEVGIDYPAILNQHRLGFPIVGTLSAYGILLFPVFELFLIFLTMAVVLMIKPEGLFGS